MLAIRRRLEELPRVLPFARLYLDDVEEITEILKQGIAEAFRVAFGDEEGLKITTMYTIDKDEMDNVADLEEHGGSPAKLEIRVKGNCREFCVAGLGSQSSPVRSS